MMMMVVHHVMVMHHVMMMVVHPRGCRGCGAYNESRSHQESRQEQKYFLHTVSPSIDWFYFVIVSRYDSNTG